MAERRVEWKVRLTGAREEVARANRELEQGSSKPITWRVRLAGARAAVRDSRAEMEAESRANPVDLQVSIANAQAAALRARAEIAAALQRIPATIAVRGGIGGGGGGAVLGLTGAVDAAGNSARGFLGTLGGVSVALLRILTISGAVATALAALTAVLGQLVIVLLAAVRSLNQLAGGLALLPGAIALAGAAVATLKLGLRGISDALAAKKAAAQGAAAGLDQLTSATETQTRAQADYQTAVQDAARALDDLRTRERDLLAQRAAAEGDLADAQEAKRQAALNAYGKASDTRRADEDIAAAQARIASTDDAIDDNRFEQQRNRSGQDPSVVAARRSLADATTAVAAASAAAAGTTQQLTDAMQDLAPAARDLVEAIDEVAPAWRRAQQRIQQMLLTGSGDWVRRLTASYAPLVEEGLGSVASAFNGWGSRLTDYLVEPGTQTLVTRILASSARAIEAAGPGVVSLLDAFLTTADVGAANIATRLAPALSRSAEKLSAWVERAAADGTLDRWINNAEDALGKIGTIATTLWDVLSRLSDAAGDNDFLSMLLSVVTRADEWLSKPENFARAQSFFETIAAAFSGAFPSVLDTLGALLPVLADAALAAAPGIDLIIRSLGDFLRDHGTEVSQVVGLLATYFATFVTSLLPGLTALLPGVIQMLTTLTAGGADSPTARFFGAIVSAIDYAVQNGLFQVLAEALGSLLTTMATFAPVIVETLLPALVGFLQFVADNPELVLALAAGVAALAAAFALFAPMMAPLVGPLLGLLASPALAEALGPLAAVLAAVALAFGLLAAGFIGAWRNGTLSADWDTLSAAGGRLRDSLRTLNGALGIDWGKLLSGGLSIAGQAFDGMIITVAALTNKLAGMATTAAGVAQMLRGDFSGGGTTMLQGLQQSQNAWQQAVQDWAKSRVSSIVQTQGQQGGPYGGGGSFASGGYSTTPVHGSTWAESGAEAVLPITSKPSMDAIAGALASPIAAALSRQPATSVTTGMTETGGIERLLMQLIGVVREQGDRQQEAVMSGLALAMSGGPLLPGHDSEALRRIGLQRGVGAGVV